MPEVIVRVGSITYRAQVVSWWSRGQRDGYALTGFTARCGGQLFRFRIEQDVAAQWEKLTQPRLFGLDTQEVVAQHVEAVG